VSTQYRLYRSGLGSSATVTLRAASSAAGMSPRDGRWQEVGFGPRTLQDGHRQPSRKLMMAKFRRERDRMTWQQFKDILPVVTLLVGLLLGIVTEVLREKRSVTRERRKWKAEFERNALLDLQDALSSSEKAIEVAVMPPLQEYQKSHKWSVGHPQLASDYSATRRRIVLISSRLDDEEVRRLVKEYERTADKTFTALMTKSAPDAIKALNEATKERAKVFVAINDRIGNRVRQYG
jgi:hypothetical protein